MPRARIAAIDKERLLNAYERGDDYFALADSLGIKRRSAYAIVRRAEGLGGIVELPRGGRRHVKVDEDMRRELEIIVNENPAFTLAQINTALRQQLPQKPQISRTVLADTLEGTLLVMKKLEDCPAERNTLMTKHLRKEYAEWILQNGVRRELIFIDETGVNLYTKRTRGRAPVGQRAVRTINGRRGPNFTMLLAVSNQRGLLHHSYFQGGMTGPRFVREIVAISAVAGNDRPLSFIMDNASSHNLVFRTPDLHLPPNQEMRRLPPYSPMLSLVENAISAFKASLKRTLEESRPLLLDMTHDERMACLSQFAEMAIAAITREKSVEWFIHTQGHLPACLAMTDIHM